MHHIRKSHSVNCQNLKCYPISVIFNKWTKLPLNEISECTTISPNQIINRNKAVITKQSVTSYVISITGLKNLPRTEIFIQFVHKSKNPLLSWNNP